MEKFKNVIYIILSGLFFIGIIIIYASFRAKFHWYIFFIGAALLIVTVGVLYLYEWYRSRPKKGEEPPRMLSDLKYTGVEVKVDLTRCRIISNNWTVEEERYQDYRVQALNALTDPGKNIERVDVFASRIEYSAMIDGMRRTFRSPAIAKDKQTLHFLLEVQKETSIYIDPYHPKYYYFDLEFLSS